MRALKAAARFWKMRASWLGDGGQPVPQALADARAAICTVCPQNQPHPLWTLLTTPVATQLRQEIQLKGQMRLAVPGESGLRVCSACLCHLPLKVWTPLAHILATTPLEKLNRENPECWILSERSQNK